MVIVFAAPVVILVLMLVVPIAYRYLWPITPKRPRLLLTITLASGLVIAAVAIFWVLDVLAGIGIAGASRATDAAHATVETVLRNRLLVASAFAVVIEYLVCRLAQTITDV